MQVKGDSAGLAKNSTDLKEPLLIRRQRAVLREWTRLAEESRNAGPYLDERFQSGTQAAKTKFETDYQDVIIRFASGKEAADREFQEARRAITGRYEADRKAADLEFAATRRRVIEYHQEEKDKLKSEYQELRWTILSVLEGNKGAAEKELKEAQRRVEEGLQRAQATRRQMREFLESCRLYADYGKGTASQVVVASSQQDPSRRLQALISLAESRLAELKELKLAKYFRGERLLWLSAVLWLLLLVPLIAVAGPWYGLLGSLVVTGAAACATVAWLYSEARKRVSRVCQPLCGALTAAEALREQCEQQAASAFHQRMGQSKRAYNKEAREVTAESRRRWDGLKQQRRDGLLEAREEYRQLRAEIRECRARDWKLATEKYRRVRRKLQEAYERDSKEVHETYALELREGRSRDAAERREITGEWEERLAEIRSAITEIKTDSARLFPDWSASYWQEWTPSLTVPPAIRFGKYEIDLPGIEAPDDDSKPASAQLPALIGFSDRCSLLIKAGDEGRAQAVRVLQAVMLRLLTALPPGKVRFTIIDPVGLGQNFASFMHLADYDEALVSSRIWTEVPHIEQQLADLTGHMEKVIQKYLRDQFSTIEDYNEHAGEVAEPYRFLVAANFPVNFSSEAAHRLVSIVQAGSRCGVHTLLSVDTKQPLPQGFNVRDLELPGGVQLVWKNQRFVWQDSDFAELPLRLDLPPGADSCARILRMIGERAKEARRVEVPFEYVVPPQEEWWTADSRLGIDVPLGRVGATKRQHLRLGEGTAQHVLIAGKTGSGKSTLLHALINNLALLYSPIQVELYLVDFKKGVEFKTYATHQLPHARVVAIESEREFGLSVLQRLDAELKERGEKFRATGAQDVSAYRQLNGEALLPRILLIVDEFQEFFVEDDRIAQEAALLLDRLVRQGRAFGLHVLLGSQTLGGAYTLARSTIDQMAVRIALQCSEADAHLILSEDNSAARLLSRPGEAIYNDANGLVEGNNPFQVVWLAEERREQYLARIQALARQKEAGAPVGQIVFEGNAPADVSKNSALNRLLLTQTWPVAPAAGQAWLGEAIAIKEPTAAVFRAQSGSNLLIIGQNEQAALGILATALVSLAAQYPPLRSTEGPPARFFVMDGSPDDSPDAGLLARVVEATAQLGRVAGRRDLAGLIAEIAAEVERRQTSGIMEPALYLLVNGLQRFRELRRQDDDFGFARGGEERPNAAQQFANLLREGAALGVHTLLWCDSLNNATRTLERQAMREFEMRVLFQMSGTDSSNLIDTPLAAKLGLYRALFHSEEQGRLEKFRPYAVPSDAWLAWVRERFHSKKGESV
jgi:hypothetical protein